VLAASKQTILMRITIYFVLLLLILSCGQTKQEKQQETKTVKKESKYKSLLSKYKEKSFDTLRVYSPEELTGEYKGVQLDSSDAVLFPENIAQQHFSDTPGLFAVYKFTIDSNRLGLITRTPSEYVPSSIKLFFFDRAKDTITSYMELAESWGDAGDVWIKDAWIFKNKQDYQSFIMVQEMHYNSVEDENDTTVQKWNYYSLLNLTKEGDTISKDEKELSRKFSHLINKS
jgi:hypothetical protein